MLERIRALLTPRASIHAAPEAKESRAANVIAFFSQGRPQWSPRDYAALAREAYQGNAIAFRAVRMIAEAAASVPLTPFEGEHEIVGSTVVDVLMNPNPLQSHRSLMEAMFVNLLIAGNAYVEAVGAGGTLRELYALRPDRMRVVPGANGWPEAHVYSCDGRDVRFHRDPAAPPPILHLKFHHPLNDHYGLSPLEAAARAIDLHNEGAAWNKALLENAARPSGALTYGTGDRAQHLSEDQFARLKAELEDAFQGARNAGRPMLLEGGLSWQKLSFSPEELDFLEGRNHAAREIALAIGVPPMLLGIPGDATYANYGQANMAFWRQTVLPLVVRTADELARFLSQWAGVRIMLRPDIDAVEALSGEREALWARVNAANFLTLNEKRVATGYGTLPGGDVL